MRLLPPDLVVSASRCELLRLERRSSHSLPLKGVTGAMPMVGEGDSGRRRRELRRRRRRTWLKKPRPISSRMRDLRRGKGG